MVSIWKQGRDLTAVYTDEPELELKLSLKFGPADTVYYAESRGGNYAWHWLTPETIDQVEAYLGRDVPVERSYQTSTPSYMQTDENSR